jgi:HEAT repeat protein
MKARLTVWSIVLLCLAVVLLWLFPGARFRLLAFVSQERFHENRPTSYWLRVVSDGADAEREHAATVLGEIGKDTPQAVTPLLKALDDRDYIVRKNAARGLGIIGPAAGESVSKLCALLKGDESQQVRREAAAALGMIHARPEESIPALLQAFKDSDEWARMRAISATGYFGPDGKDALPTLAALLEQPAGQRTNAGVTALGAMQMIGEPAKPYLLKALNNKVSRSLAVEGLGSMGAREAIPEITKLLKDPDAGVRIAAARSLWKLAPKQAATVVPVLIEGVKDQKHWAVRGRAIFALGEMGPAAKESVPALREGLKDKYEDIRALAATSLGNIGAAAKAAVPDLRAALKDEDGGVREKAAKALEKIDKAEAAAAPSL